MTVVSFMVTLRNDDSGFLMNPAAPECFTSNKVHLNDYVLQGRTE